LNYNLFVRQVFSTTFPAILLHIGGDKLWQKQRNAITRFAAVRLMRVLIIAVRNVKTQPRKALSQLNANAVIRAVINLL
jgi:hypothetical protein